MTINWKEVAFKVQVELEWFSIHCQVCNCSPDSAYYGDGECWYRLTPEQQQEQRLTHVASILKEAFDDHG